MTFLRDIRKRRAVIDRRSLSVTLADLWTAAPDADAGRQAVLSHLKDAYERGRTEMLRRLEAGESGPLSCATHTYLMDQLVRAIYDLVVGHMRPGARPALGDRFAVVAVGGYGRGHMLPYSDVDLLFLHNARATEWVESAVEAFLYLMWDMGLKVGHATRSVEDCLRMSREDVTVRTALLERRFVYGEQTLYETLDRRYRLHAHASDLNFVEAKLDERNERHRRMGGSRYQLEPNVKDGKGGLRDLHTLVWLARYVYGVDDLKDLIDRGVLSAEEYRTFTKAEAFLLTVRAHLHAAAGRAEERLTFDMQTKVGARLGYTDRRALLGVERFMRHYFLIAKDVGDLTRLLCAAIEDGAKTRPRFPMPFAFHRAREVEGFNVEGGRIRVTGEDVFAEAPVRMIEMFLVAQAYDLDIHPDSLRLVKANLGRIDRAFKLDPQANNMFMDILTSSRDPERALRRMNEAGVLGKFVPDFGRVVAQMQFDLYHTYTVDEHTLRAVGTLWRLENGEIDEDQPLARHAIKRLTNRRVLYVAVLLHDIAKGRGGDHSLLGADVARRLGPRFGLTPGETETVAWLVHHHLTLSMTATKRDIDDPKTVQDFAGIVQSLERLHLLCALTCADIRAVGPTTWTPWKAQLIRDLYYRTEDALGGENMDARRAVRIGRAQHALAERLAASWSAAAIDTHVDRMLPSYWLHHDTDTHVWHADLLTQIAGADGSVVEPGYAIDTRIVPDRGVLEIAVAARDRRGLFSGLAGAISLSNAQIVEARIDTTLGGLALDMFSVQEADGGAIEDPGRVARMIKRLTQVLNGLYDPEPGLEDAARNLSGRDRALTVMPNVYIDTAASNTHTVVETVGRDRPGLLFRLTRALGVVGLSIATARVSTFGQRAVDVFYVKDVYGLKITHPAKLKQVENALLAALSDGDDEVPVLPNATDATPTAPRARPLTKLGIQPALRP